MKLLDDKDKKGVGLEEAKKAADSEPAEELESVVEPIEEVEDVQPKTPTEDDGEDLF
jgi:hypothetical protein